MLYGHSMYLQSGCLWQEKEGSVVLPGRGEDILLVSDVESGVEGHIYLRCTHYTGGGRGCASQGLQSHIGCPLKLSLLFIAALREAAAGGCV